MPWEYHRGQQQCYCQLSPSETHRTKYDMQFSERLELCFNNYFSLLLLQRNWVFYFVGLTSNLFFMMVEILRRPNIILKMILLNRNYSDTMHYKVITFLSTDPGTLMLHLKSLSKIFLFSFSKRNSLIFSNLILNYKLGSP